MSRISPRWPGSRAARIGRAGNVPGRRSDQVAVDARSVSALPQQTALLTAMLLDGPLCIECIKEKSGLTRTDDIAKALRQVVSLLVLRRYELDQCRGCAEERQVFVLERPDA